MSSTTRFSSRRSLLALIALGLLMILFVSLGRWQLDRAQERRALAEQIAHGREQAPVHVDSQVGLEHSSFWQTIALQGTWRGDLTVLLDNRNFKGKPGYWVATPFVLDQGTLTGSAILVLRGWLARQPGRPPRPPAVPGGPQHIEGELLERVPRLFELGASPLPATLPDPAGTLPVVQNLTVNELSARSGLKMQAVVLAQTSPSGALLTDWPDPNIDFEKNNGYALQWFGFALIALCAWLGVAWKWLRRTWRAPSTTRKA
ncbi:SURF1 family protein [Alcaligenes sp. SDU_A2]|uniref:SURF1 family protein n=1 Tax=Alcaligenes sp. SDU_A2 TaxID=3136634 RepID=UPI00311D68A2